MNHQAQFDFSRSSRPWLAGVCIAFAMINTRAAAAATLDWTRQLGSTELDFGNAVSADGSGNVYFAGYTQGDLAGPNAGSNDAWVGAYGADGALLWKRQLGTLGNDICEAASADGLGSVYVAGFTDSDLAGAHLGGNDAWVARYDATGALLWKRQLGTAGGDVGLAVSADGLGNMYVAGRTTGNLAGPNAGSGDAWVGKYDANGALLWTRQLGTPGNEFGFAVSADGLGNVYVAGSTTGSFIGPSPVGAAAWVGKYDGNGELLWTRQLGAAGSVQGFAASADGLGNVYVAGSTNSDLASPNAGSDDAWVAKYDSAGTLVWSRQLGTTGGDIGRAVSADGLGNIYVAGETTGNLGGANAGLGTDAWLARYDSTGTLQWTHQLGTGSSDSGQAVSADGVGNVYLAGDTFGSLSGSDEDVAAPFVAKYVDIIAPANPADFDNDGDVDGADFLAWQRHVGLTSGATRAQGDANADGRVDAADLALWKSHFGPAGSATALAIPPSPVPEPSAIALAGPALALLFAARNGWRVSPKLAAILGENRQH